MLRNSSPKAMQRAKRLRREMSPPERRLWSALRGGRIGFRVLRQHPVGDYTLDFYLPEALLCIEVDGCVHELKGERDRRRDEALLALGIQTARVSAADAMGSPWAVAECVRLIACERAGKSPT